MNFIQIEIYSLKSPNYELFVVASNFLWCHWNMLLTVWTVIVKHWLWYSFAVKDDNFKEHRYPLNGRTFFLKAKNCFRQNSKQIFRWEIDIYSNEEKKYFESIDTRRDGIFSNLDFQTFEAFVEVIRSHKTFKIPCNRWFLMFFIIINVVQLILIPK